MSSIYEEIWSTGPGTNEEPVMQRSGPPELPVQPILLPRARLRPHMPDQPIVIPRARLRGRPQPEQMEVRLPRAKLIPRNGVR